MNDAPHEITPAGPNRVDQPRRRKARPVLRLVIVLVLLGAVGSGLIYFHRFKAGILKTVVTQITSQLPTVATVKASVQDWQPALTATGTLRASSGADLSAEVDLPHAQPSRERRADELLRHQRLLRRHLGAGVLQGASIGVHRCLRHALGAQLLQVALVGDLVQVGGRLQLLQPGVVIVRP